MKLLFCILFPLVLLTNCTELTSHKDLVCNCCFKTYSNLDSAFNCILLTPDSLTTADQRLFLFAFVNKDIQKNQELGWDILKDKDIIKIAKQRYLLIIQDVNEPKYLKRQMTPELMNLMKSPSDKPHFVIANQSLYPFADWTSEESNDFIIGRLEVGDGP